MELKAKVISCPKNMINSIETYNFLLDIQRIIRNSDNETILLDMSNTKVFEVNLLAFISVIIDEDTNGKNKIGIITDAKIIYDITKIRTSLFNMFSNDTRSFFKPRLIIGNKNSRETEDVLIKYLKAINLKHYNKIKTLISEMIANIKMHVKKIENGAKGYLAAASLPDKNLMIVSIVNNCKTIKDTLQDREYEFGGDYNAIIWALKKNNSSRKDEESGGIGLYLLRKYLKELNAEATIISGKCCLKLDSRSYNIDNENEIIEKGSEELSFRLEGTIITLYIPMELNEDKVDIVQQRQNVNLSDFMEV